MNKLESKRIFCDSGGGKGMTKIDKGGKCHGQVKGKKSRGVNEQVGMKGGEG